MDVLDAIRTKRAVRKFKDQPLPKEAVRAILNAGRRAQSSRNTQPWHFVAVEDRERLKQIAETGAYAKHMAGAALAVLIITPDPAGEMSVLFDAGQAAGYMQLAAWALGVGSAIATLHEGERARELLGIPEGQQVRWALSFGYPDDPGDLDRPPKPGGRKPFDEVIHFEQW
jgi:nitroreductase